MNLIIHAPNVHTGGGKVLLNALLSALPDDFKVILQCDDRLLVEAPHVTIIRVKPTIFSRMMAEKRLASLSNKETLVLCFGNLPPVFKNPGKVSLFLQCRYLVDKQSMKGFPLKTKLRLWFEKKWLKFRLKNIDQCIVQTPTMARLFQETFPAKMPMKILPLVEKPINFDRSFKSEMHKEGQYDFVYIASGEPHKNHRRLIEAWKLLAKENIYPSLCLSLDKQRSKKLLDWVEQEKCQCDLNIDNLEITQRQELWQILGDSRAVIFPSLFESFGLPLIEAREAGLPIIASELDFVRDIVDPEETFDPLSSVSIARAVKRFLRISETSVNFVNGKGFLDAIFQND